MALPTTVRLSGAMPLGNSSSIRFSSSCSHHASMAMPKGLSVLCSRGGTKTLLPRPSLRGSALVLRNLASYKVGRSHMALGCLSLMECLTTLLAESTGGKLNFVCTHGVSIMRSYLTQPITQNIPLSMFPLSHRNWPSIADYFLGLPCTTITNCSSASIAYRFSHATASVLKASCRSAKLAS